MHNFAEIQRYAPGAMPYAGDKTQNPVSKVWNKIGFVDGYGTTTAPITYSFVDKNVSYGIYLYRIKQIEMDGSCEFSEEIEIKIALTQEYALIRITRIHLIHQRL